MKPRQGRRFAVFTLAIAVLLVLFACRASFVVEYHTWRMNASYDVLFGKPSTEANGLTGYDVSDIDVDGVLATYSYHRDKLVELKALVHLSTRLHRLESDGSMQQAQARSNFSQRMWGEFPGHRHYHLDPEGNFETWIRPHLESKWQSFLEAEVARDRAPK